jgi:hypothetical protein
MSGRPQHDGVQIRASRVASHCAQDARRLLPLSAACPPGSSRKNLLVSRIAPPRLDGESWFLFHGAAAIDPDEPLACSWSSAAFMTSKG